MSKDRREFWIDENCEELDKNGDCLGECHVFNQNVGNAKLKVVELRQGEAVYNKAKVEKLVEAIKFNQSMISCIRHNCPVDSLYLALNPSQPIVIEHIDMATKQNIVALEAWNKDETHR